MCGTRKALHVWLPAAAEAALDIQFCLLCYYYLPILYYLLFGVVGGPCPQHCYLDRMVEQWHAAWKAVFPYLAFS